MANFGERYVLISRIGSGGMGEVWLAHDEQLASRPVAIKIMHQHMLPNGGDVARFEREMRFAAMMDHPNIVTVYTTGTYEDAPFMVMEYLRGNDLEKAPSGGDAELVAGMGRDICSTLAYAHRKGVLHRDIKPSNLFLCEGGQVKVTDFGVARAVGGTALTSAGVLVGTFAYLPPERWRGEPPAFSNDIWAAGCVLYRLISGRLPRVLPDAADYAAAAARGDPITDLHDITDAPAWLAAPVMAMLAGDPADRPTAVDCLKLLSGARPARPAGRAAAQAASPGGDRPRPPRPKSGHRRGRRARRHIRDPADGRADDSGPLPASALGRRRDRECGAAAARGIDHRVAAERFPAGRRTGGARRRDVSRGQPNGRNEDPGRARGPVKLGRAAGLSRRLSRGLPLRVARRLPARVARGFPLRVPVAFPRHVQGRHPLGQPDGQRVGREHAAPRDDPRRGRPDLRESGNEAREPRVHGRGKAHARRANRDPHQPFRAGAGRKLGHRRVRHRGGALTRAVVASSVWNT